MEMRSVEWNSLTCKFGYTVQGIFMGSTDPNFINCLEKANYKKVLVSGDDDRHINVYNYPCLKDNPKVKKYW